MSTIGIIDYGVGNLRSVQKALEHVGARAALLRRPQEASAMDRLILPGVGAFADGMALLEQRGWAETVRAWAGDGRPLLGICLGMQLLFDGSEEDAPADGGLVPGLGLLAGRVERFDEARGDAMRGGRLKVPHMGWNTLRCDRDDPLLRGLERDAAVYFVHSYYCRPDAAEVISGRCDYGGEFCATVWRGNLWATQFHPEKSQRVGLQILANFATAPGSGPESGPGSGPGSSSGGDRGGGATSGGEGGSA
jgi:glutamine amidotransferase